MVKKIDNERRMQKNAAEPVIMSFLWVSAFHLLWLLPDSSTPPATGQAWQSPADGGINHWVGLKAVKALRIVKEKI
jgi:hypothetical protein